MTRRRRVLAATLATLLAVGVPASAAARPVELDVIAASTSTLETGSTSTSLETAASRASSIGRTIAFSLIGLALAAASVALVFRRDFKEAVGLFAIGIIAIMLASPVGLSVLESTVTTLFGSG
jgi:hypothetical protein